MKWKAKHTSLLVIAIGFAIFYLLFKRAWMLTPIGVCVIGFIIGPVGDFTHIVWMQLAKVLGYINSRVLLFLLFFLILTPLAFMQKLFQSKSKKALSPESCFTARNHLFVKSDLIKPW